MPLQGAVVPASQPFGSAAIISESHLTNAWRRPSSSLAVATCCGKPEKTFGLTGLGSSVRSLGFQVECRYECQQLMMLVIANSGVHLSIRKLSNQGSRRHGRIHNEKTPLRLRAYMLAWGWATANSEFA